MRNDLSHMDLGKNMQIEDSQVKEYFKNLTAMVDCLARLHPQHFTAPQDIQNELKEVSIITSSMPGEQVISSIQHFGCLFARTKHALRNLK